MAEYIERDAAIKYLEIHKKEAKENNFVLCANEDSIIKFLREKCPTADVVEVKHGEWMLHPDGSGTCSCCNRMQKSVWDYDNAQNFCGHCGADMRGEKNDL